MKTFRLVSLQLADDDSLIDIEFKAGLIINKEDDQGTWLIEAFVEKQYIPVFEEACSENKDIITQVVITKKENDPAAFKVKVCSVKAINDHACVLMRGKLTRLRSDYPAQLLEHLMELGYTDSQLVDEFRKNIVTRPKLVLPKKE
ncbi:YwpF family protein [Bacillus massilinigeriensis]|uniref:YwpF family protein n=1 Tax=Bacillus mediterraneensis TaxID=1805474 RepID=UPI0008F8AA15|nr:YwpF family protein [Bacillus mediterraneensis]